LTNSEGKRPKTKSNDKSHTRNNSSRGIIVKSDLTQSSDGAATDSVLDGEGCEDKAVLLQTLWKMGERIRTVEGRHGILQSKVSALDTVLGRTGAAWVAGLRRLVDHAKEVAEEEKITTGSNGRSAAAEGNAEPRPLLRLLRQAAPTTSQEKQQQQKQQKRQQLDLYCYAFHLRWCN